MSLGKNRNSVADKQLLTHWLLLARSPFYHALCSFSLWLFPSSSLSWSLSSFFSPPLSSLSLFHYLSISDAPIRIRLHTIHALGRGHESRPQLPSAARSRVLPDRPGVSGFHFTKKRFRIATASLLSTLFLASMRAGEDSLLVKSWSSTTSVSGYHDLRERCVCTCLSQRRNAFNGFAVTLLPLGQFPGYCCPWSEENSLRNVKESYESELITSKRKISFDRS